MSVRVSRLNSVVIDGIEIREHVMAVSLNVTPGSMDTLFLTLRDVTVSQDPETGAITFTVGKDKR